MAQLSRAVMINSGQQPGQYKQHLNPRSCEYYAVGFVLHWFVTAFQFGVESLGFRMQASVEIGPRLHQLKQCLF